MLLLVRLILSFLWLYVPPIGLIVLVPKAITDKVVRVWWVIVLLVWVPMLGVLVGLWPAHVIFFDREVRTSIQIPHYQVDFVEDPGVLEHRRYFEVTQATGKQAIFLIDHDAKKCQNPVTKQVASKIYFLCAGQDVSNNTSYVDTERLSVYSGWDQTEEKIYNLEFE
jgi:hypothetical protein